MAVVLPARIASRSSVQVMSSRYTEGAAGVAVARAAASLAAGAVGAIARLIPPKRSAPAQQRKNFEDIDGL